MEPYNMELLQNELQKLSVVLKGKNIGKVASFEHLADSTVREYLKGKIAYPAVAKAIVERGRAVLIEKKSLTA